MNRARMLAVVAGLACAVPVFAQPAGLKIQWKPWFGPNSGDVPSFLIDNPNSTDDFISTTSGSSGGITSYTVTIDVPSTYTDYTAWRVFTLGQNDKITSLVFKGAPVPFANGGTTAYDLIVGSSLGDESTQVFPGAGEVGGVTTLQSAFPVNVRVGARTVVGSVSAQIITRVEAGIGQTNPDNSPVDSLISGPINADAGRVGTVIASRIGSSASLPASIIASASIVTVTTDYSTAPSSGGDIFAAINGSGGVGTVLSRGTLNGSVTAGGTSPIVLVQGKTGVGSSADAFDLTGPGIQTLYAGDFVPGTNVATVAGDFHLAANLSGPITRMRAVRFNGSGGDFNGTLTAASMTNSLSDRLVIDDEHKGTITLTSTGQKDVITIGRAATLASGNLFSFGTSGLLGQVVVNQNDASATWSGAAAVGSTSLSPVPDYANLSASLGGGAIGVGPYRLHREDCVPSNTPVGGGTNTLGLGVTPDASTWNTLLVRRDRFDDLPAAQDDLEVRMRWYGPISSSGCRLVTVERSADPTFTDPGMIIDETARFFAVGEGPQDPNLLRDLRLRRRCGEEGLPTGYYRVVRNVDAAFPVGAGGVLQSKLVSGDPEVQPFAFYFRLGGCNPADVGGANQSPDGDGQLTADDIIVFLNWYFANDMRADFAGPNQSTTPDQQLTADDIIVFLNFYFAQCENPDGPRLCDGNEVEPPKCSKDGAFEDAGRSSSPSGQRMGSMAGPTEGTDGASDAASAAQRIAAMQAMIAAETDPQRRATLQAALAILQAASAVNENE